MIQTQLHPLAGGSERRRRAGRRAVMLLCTLLACLALSSCSGGGIYANVGIAGPSVDLGPVSINTGVSLGRFL